jgi:predicted 3-demethylubiquinone-9 3-methyltransferase (glyoxalase superfamily)
MQKITPCLWFNFNAEEAVKHYSSIFRNVKVLETSHYGEAMPQHKGKVLTIRFELEGQVLLALNGGPQFKFSEAVSLSVNCADQKEVDRLWDKLSEGGSKGPCGWLKDKFGFSWQIVPEELPRMLNDPDAERRERVFAAMMQMQKLDIASLRAAYEGRQAAHA